jgi:sec-independent protein translocase protein TatA
MLTTTLNPMLALFFGPPGMGEILILAAVGLLIFGKRLPEVGKSLGKGIVEFKKGLTGIEDNIKKTPAPPADDTQSLSQPTQAHGSTTTDAEESGPKHTS